jgi:hypothetical protein
MNKLFVLCIIVIVFLLLCSKQENYYNVFGQYVDGPSDEMDGVNEFSPQYGLSRRFARSPYFGWWNFDISYLPGYHRYWRHW